MKKNNLESVSSLDLKNELEKRWGMVHLISKNIENWKHSNKIIEFEDLGDYCYLGETKDFTKEQFEKTIREFLNIDNDEKIDIYQKFYRLKKREPFIVEGEIHSFTLEECDKEAEGSFEVWSL